MKGYLKEIKVLVFDLDDTLYNEEEYVFSAFKFVSEYIGKKFKKNEETVYKRILDIYMKEGRGKIFDILCEELNINEGPKTLVSIYRSCKPKLKLYKDSEEILIWAKSNNIRTGLITDGCSKVQWNKIESLKLNKKIEKIIVTDDYGEGYSKPNKKPYLDILSYFSIKPFEVVYIGDNPKKDFITAKKIGMKTIRIVRQCGSHIKKECSEIYEAERRIHNLEEIIFMED